MKYRTIFLGLFFSAILFTSCFDLLDTEDPCTECQDAMNHLAGAIESGRLGCTSYINSNAFYKVINNCKNGRDKAYAVVDYYCTGFGGIPAACE